MIKPSKRSYLMIGCLFYVLLLGLAMYSKTTSISSLMTENKLLSNSIASCSNIDLHQDQCAFVKKSCHGFKAVYLKLYYCSTLWKPTIIAILLLCMLILFCAISVVASDFFCPNLQTISEKLQLSESMAGVTVLALGNGSSDLFSTFSALDTGAGSLAIGELIGAAFFIVAIVSGSMCIIRPFQSQRITFKRDATFLTGAIMIITWIVYHQRIYWYHSVILISYYITYVCVVVLGAYHINNSTHAPTEFKDENLLLNESTHLLGGDRPPQISIPTRSFPSVHSNLSEFSSQHNLGHVIRPLSPNSSRRSIYFDAMLPRSTSATASILTTRTYRRPMTPKVGMRPSVFGAIEFQQQVNHIRRASSSLILPGQRQQSMPPPTWQTLQGALLSPQPQGRQRASTINDQSPDYFTYISTPEVIQVSAPSSPPAVPEIRLAPPNDDWLNPTMGRSRRSTYSLAPPSPFSDDAFVSARQSLDLPHEEDMYVEQADASLLPALFPTLQDWSQKTTWSRLSSLAAAPFVLVFTLTLPVAEMDEIKVDDVVVFEEEEIVKTSYLSVPVSVNDLSKVTVDQVDTKQGWNKHLFMVQCFVSPVFIFSLFALNGFISVSMVFVGLLIGVGLANAANKLTKKEEPPAWYWMLSFFGFFVALNWIFLLANEVVGLLQALGQIFSISEAIMGLTIFALGNSVGDFVANTAIAKMGFPTMAISACYAGPLLNMVLGVGVSSFYQTWKTGTFYPLEIAPTIIVSACGLITVLLSTIIVVNINGFKVTRQLGWWMIIVYFTCCTTNFLLEFGLIF